MNQTISIFSHRCKQINQNALQISYDNIKIKNLQTYHNTVCNIKLSVLHRHNNFTSNQDIHNHKPTGGVGYQSKLGKLGDHKNEHMIYAAEQMPDFK